MNITIASEEDINSIGQVIEQPFKKWPQFLRTLAEFYSDQEDFSVTISKPLLSTTYRINPSTLARQLDLETIFNAPARSRVDGAFVEISCSASAPADRGFPALVLATLQDHPKFPKRGTSATFEKSEMPRSYWARPEMFTYNFKKANDIVLSHDRDRNTKTLTFTIK